MTNEIVVRWLVWGGASEGFSCRDPDQALMLLELYSGSLELTEINRYERRDGVWFNTHAWIWDERYWHEYQPPQAARGPGWFVDQLNKEFTDEGVDSLRG